jgi:hypothetical protein
MVEYKRLIGYMGSKYPDKDFDFIQKKIPNWASIPADSKKTIEKEWKIFQNGVLGIKGRLSRFGKRVKNWLGDLY